MEVDEDDPVVMEIPVFLATQLASEMHVLQFPLRPADRHYDDAHHNAPTAAVFKPKVRARAVRAPSRAAHTMLNDDGDAGGRARMTGPAARAGGADQHGRQLRRGGGEAARHVLPADRVDGGRARADADTAARIDDRAEQDALRRRRLQEQYTARARAAAHGRPRPRTR